MGDEYLLIFFSSQYTFAKSFVLQVSRYTVSSHPGSASPHQKTSLSQEDLTHHHTYHNAIPHTTANRSRGARLCAGHQCHIFSPILKSSDHTSHTDRLKRRHHRPACSTHNHHIATRRRDDAAISRSRASWLPGHHNSDLWQLEHDRCCQRQPDFTYHQNAYTNHTDICRHIWYRRS